MVKTALITGSSKGLGRHLALEFSKGGYNIILHGRDPDALEEINANIEGSGVSCTYVTGDLTSVETLSRLESIARSKDIEVLINNAGVYLGKKLQDMSPEELRKVMEINFFAPVELTRRILPFLKQKKAGLILNINTIAGKQGSSGESAYAASKHALRGFMDSLKFEIISDGIRIVNIYPGSIASQMTAARGDPDLMIQPHELAKLIYGASREHASLNAGDIDVGRRLYKQH